MRFVIAKSTIDILSLKNKIHSFIHWWCRCFQYQLEPLITRILWLFCYSFTCYTCVFSFSFTHTHTHFSPCNVNTNKTQWKLRFSKSFQNKNLYCILCLIWLAPIVCVCVYISFLWIFFFLYLAIKNIKKTAVFGLFIYVCECVWKTCIYTQTNNVWYVCERHQYMIYISVKSTSTKSYYNKFQKRSITKKPKKKFQSQVFSSLFFVERFALQTTTTITTKVTITKKKH